jgi:hypothetical protein
MGKNTPKVLQMPPPKPQPLTEAEWEQLARETFAERKVDVGRVPNRRRPSVPPVRPDKDPPVH